MSKQSKLEPIDCKFEQRQTVTLLKLKSWDLPVVPEMANYQYTWPDASEMRRWLAVDETAETMMRRLHERRLPTITPTPPLHRAPLHGRNVLEIAGPSGSGKSELLLQSVVLCILPKEWEGLSIGGSEKPVLYFDLDGRFDMRRLVRLLECRFYDAEWRVFEGAWEAYEAGGGLTSTSSAQQLSLDKDFSVAGTSDPVDACNPQRTLKSIKNLIRTSLKRFYLKRCHNSFEFLAALKTISSHLKQVAAEHGSGPELLIVDSIIAFYWVERSTRTTLDQVGRRTLSLQTVSGAVVNELRLLVQLYPKLLIMATKALILKHWVNETSSFKNWQSRRNNSKVSRPGFRRLPMEIFKTNACPSKGTAQKGSTTNATHREFLPASWRGFVTHRVIVRGPYQSALAPTDRLLRQSTSFFTAQWEKPFSANIDFFTIQNDGIKLA